MRSLGRQVEPREGRPLCWRHLAPLAGALVALALLLSCGGGGGAAPSSSGSNTSTPDFSISLSSSSLKIQPGNSASVTVSATGSNGFSGSINVRILGSLPAGMTVSPSSLTLTPGSSQTMTFSVASTAAIGSSSVTLSATSGSVTHSAGLTLAVYIPVTSNTPPFRMRYVRTDASTLYMGWPNSHWIVYNPPTKRFFVTDPAGNRVYAIDAATETVVGSIPVPGAYGIDDTPDHSLLYVGTQIGDVYAIDPVSMTVTHRYRAPQIGPNGFQAYSVQVMADGRLALLGAQSPDPGVLGYAGFALWNPADNSISLYSTQYGATALGLQAGSYTEVCGPSMGNIGVFRRTPDRSHIIIGSIFSDGTLCEVNETTGGSQYVQIVTPFIYHIAISPDGKWLVTPNSANGANQMYVLDAHTLAQVATFPVAGDTGDDSVLFVGPDSKTLYIPSFPYDSILYAYDITTGHQVGWLPGIVVAPYIPGGGLGPIYGPDFQAVDGTGLLAGPLNEGVGFVDTSTLRTGPSRTQYADVPLIPATGPTGGGTQVTWPAPGNITDVYFGSQRSPSVSASSTGLSTATTPPGAPGPADMYTLDADGGIEYVPEGFSYGPTILQVTPNASTSEGGGTGVIYGYGFGPTDSTTATVPSGLTVLVGQEVGKITSFDPNAYGTTSPSPFPLQSITYTIPAGAAGTTVGVRVTTSIGTTAVQNGMTYLPALKQYPAPGAELAQGIYDPYNDLYYFTDATEIRVFSRTDGQWLPPIPIPAADNPQRLWGIALSPDGSKMAVADAQGEAIYVLNPGSSAAPQKFTVPQPTWAGLTREPIAVAITDGGIVYFADFDQGSGVDLLYKLDTSSGQMTAYNIGLPPETSGNYLRVALKSDNSVVYGNDNGGVFSVDTATDKVSVAWASAGYGSGSNELALSSDQTRLTAAGYFYDANLNAESYESVNIREAMGISYIYGQKLSPDGRLLFQPTTLGIDVMDGHVGTLLDRIALPMPLSPNYDALVSDGKDNVLVAITGATGNGIAVIDLSSIPEPPLPAYDSATVSATSSTALTAAPAVETTLKRQQKSSQQAQPEPRRRTIPYVTVHNLLLQPR